MASYNDILLDIHEATTQLLGETGMASEQADVIATAIIERIQKKSGGSMTYIPKHVLETVSARNARIVEEFTGANHLELSRKYQLSTKQIYQILRENYQSSQTSWMELT